MGPANMCSDKEPAEEISSVFKLQWLNTTLKFIKNDKELILNYPELSVDRIKFLQDMISGRNADIALGYKQLYIPLWEALKIIGVKYEFKMRVQHTANNTGPSSISDSDSSDNDIEPTRREQISKQYLAKMHTTVDSISPSFIKASLQKFHDFVTDVEKASMVFDNLARIETTFLQNLLGVLKRREALEELFSPMCNALLQKIGAAVETSDSFRLEMSTVSLDEGTSRRHLTFKKTPYFAKKKNKKSISGKKKESTRPSTAAQIKKSLAAQKCKVNDLSAKLETLSVKGKLENLRDELKKDIPQAIDKPPTIDKNKGAKDNVKNANAIDKKVLNKSNSVLPQSLNNAVTAINLTSSINGCEKKNEAEVSTIDKPTKPIEEKTFETLIKENKHIQVKTDNVVMDKELLQKAVVTANGDIKAKSTDKPIECQILRSNEEVKMHKPTDNTGLRDIKARSTDKPIECQISKSIGEGKINKQIDNTGSSKSTIKNAAKDKPKASTIDKMDVKSIPKGAVKLMEGLTKPVESDIAIRMMKSMGWEGGALGAREGGIIEPIMPAVHLVKNAGLGHVQPARGAGGAAGGAAGVRRDVLQAILHALRCDSAVSFAHLPAPLGKRERQRLHALNRALNARPGAGAGAAGAAGAGAAGGGDEAALLECIVAALRESPRLKFFVEIKKRLLRIEKLEEPMHDLPPELRENNPDERDKKDSKKKKGKDSKITEAVPPKEVKRKLFDYIYAIDANNNGNDFLDKDYIVSLLNDNERSELNTKMINLLKDRLFIMKMCFHFLRSDKTDVTISVNINVVSVKFVKHLTVFVNKRRPSLKTSLENMVWSELVHYIGECYLIYWCDGPKSFGFSKVYRPERSISNASGSTGVPKEIDQAEITPSNTDGQDNDKMCLNFSNKQNAGDLFVFGNNSSDVIDGNTRKIDEATLEKETSIAEGENRTNLDINKKEDTGNPYKTMNDEIKKIIENIHDCKKITSCHINDVINIRITGETNAAMSEETAKGIQIRIWNAVRDPNSNFLPALKCHGINNDSLLYSCFSYETCAWLTRLLPDYRVLPYNKCDSYVMTMRLRAYDDSLDVVACLKVYYAKIDVAKWRVVETVYRDGELSVIVLMDWDSFKFISDSGFRLYAGVDEVSFEILLV